MYTIQGLWSAAHYDVPLVLVVMNNREYAACKRGIARVVADGGDRYVGMDLTDPEIDFIGLARSLGVEARSAGGADELSSAVSEALASGRPDADRRGRRRHPRRAVGQARRALRRGPLAARARRGAHGPRPGCDIPP